jgi:hypothetical protein
MTPTSAQDDLAFMCALVERPGNFQRSFGEAYFAAGLCYGVQMLLHAAQGAGWIAGGPMGLVIGIGPTVVFLILLAWIIHRHRGEASGSVVSRAVGAMFGATGLANLVLICVIGSVAWREQSLTIWLIYPCTVIVLQGMAWLVTYALRRRIWFAIVGLGWFVTAIAMGLTVTMPSAFIAITGMGFLAFMLVPGLVIMSQAKGA